MVFLAAVLVVGAQAVSSPTPEPRAERGKHRQQARVGETCGMCGTRLSVATTRSQIGDSGLNSPTRIPIAPNGLGPLEDVSMVFNKSGHLFHLKNKYFKILITSKNI